MQRMTPCIWFTKDAEEAIKLYTSVFKDSKIKKMSYYNEAGAKVSGMPAGAVMSVDFEILGQPVQALNGGPYFNHTAALSLFVTCSSSDEVDRLYTSLSSGGKDLIPLGKYPFSDRYVFFADKFGVHWQLILQKDAKAALCPSIIFGGDNRGKGPAALEFYKSLFKTSKVIIDERYKKGEGGIEGSIKHARIDLDGSILAVMDSGHNHPIPMTGAISLVMHCKDQAEVDYFWDKFTQKGQEVQCGWITDQFGVSWQIVPNGLENYVSGSDPKRAEKAMAAMLQMKKLDINKIKQAYEG